MAMFLSRPKSTRGSHISQKYWMSKLLTFMKHLNSTLMLVGFMRLNDLFSSVVFCRLLCHFVHFLLVIRMLVKVFSNQTHRAAQRFSVWMLMGASSRFGEVSLQYRKPDYGP